MWTDCKHDGIRTTIHPTKSGRARQENSSGSVRLDLEFNGLVKFGKGGNGPGTTMARREL
jgi:hypothetical protein